MTLRLPVGLYIPGGVRIAVDGGTATEVPLQTCEANGCFAAAPVPAALLAAMKRGKQVSVNMQDMAKKPVSLTLPLDGFAASWAQIE
jgi:invasion protein IalB